VGLRGVLEGGGADAVRDGPDIDWAWPMAPAFFRAGATWLHWLHLGVIAAEAATEVETLVDAAGGANDTNSIPGLFRQSLKLKDNALAWRFLATTEANTARKHALYASAWRSALADTDTGTRSRLECPASACCFKRKVAHIVRGVARVP
jgi:hypothetical protein